MSDTNTNGGAMGDATGSGNNGDAQYQGNDHSDPNAPAPGGSQQAGNTGGESGAGRG